MKRTVLIILSILLLAITVLALTCKYNRTKLIEPTQYVTNIIVQNMPFVTIPIDDADYLLLIDTGASISLIDSAFAYNTGMQIDSININAITAQTIQSINSQTFLNIKFDSMYINHNFYIFDLAYLNKSFNMINIIGILGFDYMQMHNVALDFANNKFRQQY